jgi:hypothetical protein
LSQQITAARQTEDGVDLFVCFRVFVVPEIEVVGKAISQISEVGKQKEGRLDVFFKERLDSRENSFGNRPNHVSVIHPHTGNLNG